MPSSTELVDGVVPPLDLIVSNPPYISPLLAPTLLPEVLKHEPTNALFSDDNGFAIVKQLLQQAVQRLKPSGYLLLEVGSGMASTIAQWQLTQTYFEVCRILQDYAGHERFLTLRRCTD
jgi:release factor glutamine methyltransferase